MSRRKVVTPLGYLRRKAPERKVTKYAVGLHHCEMSSRGLVTSSSVTEPSCRARVWIDRNDKWASLMVAARDELIVSIADIGEALSSGDVSSVPHESLSLLGIVAVPMAGERVRLLGTSPAVARIANHVHWGLRRRRVTAEELIEATFGLTPNGRKTSVTDGRLEEAIVFFFDRFEIDFSDVVDRAPVLL